MILPKATDCDLYQNPYRTRCRGSISPDEGIDGTVSVCWRHLQANRDYWMQRAMDADASLNAYDASWRRLKADERRAMRMQQAAVTVHGEDPS